MSLYCYGDNSTIKEIAVRRSAGRGVRSFLYLGDRIKSEDTTAIKNTLIEEGWHCVPTQVGGRDCLEVRGARKIDALEEALRGKGFLAATRSKVVKDDEKIPIKDKFKSNLQLIYGIMTMTSDIGMIGYGFLHDKILKQGTKQWENLASGLAYSAGSISFAAFGRGDKSDHHMRDIAAGLVEELDSKGIKVSKGTALDSFTDTSNLDNTERFKRVMHKHSAAIGNEFTALAGAFIAKGALKSGTGSTKVIDSILGLSTFTAGTTAALVKEKAHDPDEPEAHGVAKITRWIQERPNRIAGIGYGISSIAHAVEVVKNMAKRHEKYGDAVVNEGMFKGTPETKIAAWAYGMRGGFVALNMVGEVILASASKGRGSGVKSDRGVDETAYALVADVIARQPADAREHLFIELSRNFLAKPEVLGGDGKEIEAALRERVKKLENNPWADTPVTPERAASAPPEQENMRWRGKIAAAPLSPAITPAI